MVAPAGKTLASNEAGARLYRDDVGAAHEQIRRLEQENQDLRVEIDRIKSGRPLELPSPYRIGTVALCVATIAVGATLAFSNGGSPPSQPPDVVVVQAPLPMPTAPIVTPAPTLQQRPHPTLQDCAPPYYYDEHGSKVFKKECL